MAYWQLPEYLPGVGAGTRVPAHGVAEIDCPHLWYCESSNVTGNGVP